MFHNRYIPVRHPLPILPITFIIGRGWSPANGQKTRRFFRNEKNGSGSRGNGDPLLSGMAFGAEMVMNGSATVSYIAQAAAEKYMAANEGVKISVSGGGSGNGIKAIIDGTTRISPTLHGSSSRTKSRPRWRRARTPFLSRWPWMPCSPSSTPTILSGISPSTSFGRFTPARSPAGRTWAERTNTSP